MIDELLIEVERRVEETTPEFLPMLLERNLDRTGLQRELNKVNRPDQETFNADGSTASQSYTKARLEEIKKAKEQLGKLEGAIEKALAGDFTKLNEMGK